MTEINTVFGMVAQVIVIVGGLAGMYFGIKRWVKQTASTDQIEHQLNTGNGKTIGQLAKSTSDRVKELDNRIKTLDGRLDRHLVQDHYDNRNEPRRLIVR